MGSVAVVAKGVVMGSQVRTQPREVIRRVPRDTKPFTTLCYGSSKFPGIRLTVENAPQPLPQIIGEQDDRFLCVPEQTLNTDMVYEEEEEEEPPEELLVTRVPASVSMKGRKKVQGGRKKEQPVAIPVSPPKKLTRHIPTQKERSDVETPQKEPPTDYTYVPKMFTNKEFSSLPAPQSPAPVPLDPPSPSPRQSIGIPTPSLAPTPTPVPILFRPKMFSHNSFSLKWEDFKPLHIDDALSDTDTTHTLETDTDGDLSTSPKNISDSDVSSAPPQPQAPPLPYVPKLFNPLKRSGFSSGIVSMGSSGDLKKKEKEKERESKERNTPVHPQQTPSKSPPSSPQHFEKRRITPKKKKQQRDSPGDKKERRSSLPTKESKTRRDSQQTPPSLPKEADRRHSVVTESSTEGSPTHSSSFSLKQREEQMKEIKDLTRTEADGRRQQEAKEHRERLDLNLRSRKNIDRISRQAVEKDETKFREVISEIQVKKRKELLCAVREGRVVIIGNEINKAEVKEAAARRSLAVEELEARGEISRVSKEEEEEVRAMTPVKHVTIVDYVTSPEESCLEQPPSILLLEANDTPGTTVDKPEADLSSIATPLPEVRDEDDDDDDDDQQTTKKSELSAGSSQQTECDVRVPPTPPQLPQLPPLEDESEEDSDTKTYERPAVPPRAPPKVDVAPLELNRVQPKQLPKNTPRTARATPRSMNTTEATGSARTIPSARQVPHQNGCGCGTSCSVM
eukprot:TRINITY_DN206_c1_g1_i1.p1 TRINITY_DN206_c1_g1~~TRINITY_DN206_c1_g1_i1.p1  ORF type:complete len:765 (+),score=214.68 TRINITY_DN206_c1_g1_i1:90-2297(+)